MSNIYGKKISQLHKSIISLGGINIGVTDTPFHMCDGNGFSTGIEISLNKVNMNLRRGVLDNFISNGSMPSALYQDLDANTEAPREGTGHGIILNLDTYSAFRLHFTKNIHIRMFYLMSKYMDTHIDNHSEYAGYWQRMYGGIRYYITTSNHVVAQSELSDPDLFMLPGPFEQDGHGLKYNTGSILKKSKWKGVRHPHSSLEITLIISCDKGVEASFQTDFCMLHPLLEFITFTGRRHLDTMCFGTYILNMPFNSFGVKITEVPKAYTITLFNPSAWRSGTSGEINSDNLENRAELEQYITSGSRALCFKNGEDLLPNFFPRLTENCLRYIVLFTKLGNFGGD